jgi:hypothetical protein
MSSIMRWRSGVPARADVAMIGLQSINEADCLANQLGTTRGATSSHDLTRTAYRASGLVRVRAVNDQM